MSTLFAKVFGELGTHQTEEVAVEPTFRVFEARQRGPHLKKERRKQERKIERVRNCFLSPFFFKHTVRISGKGVGDLRGV